MTSEAIPEGLEFFPRRLRGLLALLNLAAMVCSLPAGALSCF
jgi:hypothetical protein